MKTPKKKSKKIKKLAKPKKKPSVQSITGRYHFNKNIQQAEDYITKIDSTKTIPSPSLESFMPKINRNSQMGVHSQNLLIGSSLK